MKPKLIALFLAYTSCIFGQDTLYAPSLSTFIDKEDSVYNRAYDFQYTDPDSTILYANIYLALARKKKDSLTICYAWMLKGDAHYYKNQNKKSELYYKKALHYLINNDDPFDDLSFVYSALGDVYASDGYYYKAIDYLNKALILDNKNGYFTQACYTKLSIASMHSFQYNFESAKTLIDEVISYGEKIKDPEIIFAGKYGLLDYYYENKDFAELVTLGKEILPTAEGYNDRLSLAYIHSNISVGFAYQYQPDSAIYHAQKAIEFGTAYKDPFTLIYMEIGYAETMLLLNASETALEWAQKAYNHAKAGNSRILKRASVKILQEANEALNQHELALKYYKEFKAFDDTILRMNIKERILEKEREIQSKENQQLARVNELQLNNISNKKILIFSFLLFTSILVFALLILINERKRKNKYATILVEKSKELRGKQLEIDAQTKELLKKNLELESINRTKDKLFSVLSHDIREPFVQLKGLIGLIKDAVLSPEKLHELAVKLELQSDKVNQSVDNLLIWSKGQLKGFKVNIENIYVLREVAIIKEEINDTLKIRNQILDLNIPENFVIKADKDQFYISLRNLLLNASTYSHNNATIYVNAFERESNFVVEVADNGVGITEEKLALLRNFDNEAQEKLLYERNTGLGLQIINDFMSSNGGSLEIDSVRGKGSQFRLVFTK